MLDFKKVLNARFDFYLCFALSLFLSSFQASAFPHPNRQQAAPVVGIETVQSHSVAQEIDLVGKLEANTSVILKPEISGKVEKILAQSQANVKAGDVLIEFENKQEKAAVAEALAYLKDEQRKEREYSQLISRNAITQTELQAQQASVSIAQARFDVAQADLAELQIKAPFSGTLGLIDFSQGKMFNSGDELVSLDDLSLMRLDVEVPEKYLSQISKGMQVQTYTQAFPDQTFMGKVAAIDARVNEQTLSIRVRVMIENQKKLLKPGMLLKARLAFPPVKAPLIPIQAIEYSGTKRFVYRLNSDANLGSTESVERVQVMLGTRIGEKTLVDSGIEVGDKLVTKGLVNMRDGLKVKVIEQNGQKQNTQSKPNEADSKLSDHKLDSTKAQEQ